jgi:DNA-binding CsgD family transcriptional regulator
VEFFSMAILRGMPDLTSTISSTQRKRPLTINPATPANGHPQSAEPRPLHLLMAGFEALDLVNVGLLVTNMGGQLLLANHTAEQILATRDGLEVTAGETVRTSLKSSPALNLLVEAASKAQPSEFGDAILAIRRPSGKRPFTLVIRPVQAASAATDPATPTTLIFILDPEFPVETAEEELRQLYGLTSTEACLANLLMEGKTLDDCCEILGIRRSTARTHLQHVFEKVGVQRQSELVSLLLKSIGLVRPGVKNRKSRSANLSIGAGKEAGK